MGLSTVNAWLEKIYAIHPREIELGLDRIKTVAARLQLLPLPCSAIIVGGTNGKGSTVAGLEAIYRAAGYQVGAFTSPILFRHNEYVRINGKLASDEEFCSAYNQIEAARDGVSLTPFEFHALAALLIFRNYPLQVVLLEVGLGGRLDAVNMVDGDLSIVTSIGIDHVDLLGSTRESIGFEKAGIFRAAHPAVYGDNQPPHTLLDVANRLGTVLYQHGVDFQFQEHEQTWSWHSQAVHYANLPKNSLAIENMANVLMGITLMQTKLPVSETAIMAGLTNLSLPGRIQIFPGAITRIFDVSHNSHAIALLKQRLHTMPHSANTYAVFSMLGDKDILESLKLMRSEVNHWHTAVLTSPRAASLRTLQSAFADADITAVSEYDSIQAAYTAAMARSLPGDRVIVFGSFHTVADVLRDI